MALTGKRERNRRTRLARQSKISFSELRRQRRARRHVQWLQANQPWVITEMEVALHGLSAQMQSWPDEWYVGKHGDLNDNNPHVWLKRLVGVDMLSKRERWVEICTCGLRPGNNDVRLYLDGLMRRHVR